MLPDAAGFTAALRGHFSSSALLFHSVTASGLCRSDRPGGSGSVSAQSLVPWPFVAFRSFFSVGIGETAPQPNHLGHSDRHAGVPDTTVTIVSHTPTQLQLQTVGETVVTFNRVK